MRASILLCALGTLLVLTAAGASAAPAVNKQQILKDRQALMKRQAHDLGVVKAYLGGKADHAKAVAAATDIAQTTIRKIPSVFPPGTAGPSPDGKFAPKPAVWSDWKGFLAHRDGAAHKAEALLQAVKAGNKPATQAAFVDLGKNGCGACHQKFREKLKD